MYFLKCASPVVQFTDPKTKVTIRRGQIISIDSLSPRMRQCLSANGLVQVTEEEFNAQFPKEAESKVPEVQPELQKESEVVIDDQLKEAKPSKMKR